MNKKTVKFSIILAAVPISVYALLVIAYEIVAALSTNTTLISAFFDISQISASIAEIVTYAIILYAFAYFKPSEAMKSIWIACGATTTSIVIASLPKIILALIEEPNLINKLGAISVTLYSVYVGCLPLVLPIALVALISYYVTKNGTNGIKPIFNFKKPIPRAILLSTVAVYIVKIITLFIGNDAVAIVGIVEKGQILTDAPIYTFGDFMIELWNNVIYKHVIDIVVYLVLQFFIYVLVHYLYKKFTNNDAIKNS